MILDCDRSSGVWLWGLIIDKDKGDDSAWIGNVRAELASITPGDGNDRVGFYEFDWHDVPDPFSINGSLTIDTGAGLDEVDSSGRTSVSGVIRTSTGAEGDIVFLGSHGNPEYSRSTISRLTREHKSSACQTRYVQPKKALD